ncbi:substrate-binding periplasmic protein [Spartinivicinus ruber]|uniref:substrate-binding periplasmic protein n=1 Tax=Spartinivicinus ruber TaxID=2683272 RepID=UPI0013D045C2|nr:transporter substrate-binding domain-containing protein [Spartinivicinus ruber]
MTLIAFSNPINGASLFKVNTSIKPPFSTEDQKGFFDYLLKELFNRLDIKVELIRLPAERALHMANDGVSDGEIPRIAGLQKKYQNLIQVPESVIDYHFVGFMRQPVITDMKWGSLKSVKVGMIIGWKIYENNVPPSAEITKVSSPKQLMQMANYGRVDIALYERYAGRYIIKHHHFKLLAESKPPLAIKPMFLYVHNKHKAIVNLLAKALRKMKTDGTWHKIANDTLH